MSDLSEPAAEGRLQVLIRKYRPLLIEGIKYFGASAVALAVDWALLSLLTRVFAVPTLVAATVSFLAGVAVVYLLSVRFVFREHSGSDRRFEFVVFLLIGVAGLGLNDALLWGAQHLLGVAPDIAKGPVAGATFVFNFALRKVLLFSRRSRAA